jgi:hypothetical protein
VGAKMILSHARFIILLIIFRSAAKKDHALDIIHGSGQIKEHAQVSGHDIVLSGIISGFSRAPDACAVDDDIDLVIRDEFGYFFIVQQFQIFMVRVEQRIFSRFFA